MFLRKDLLPGYSTVYILFMFIIYILKYIIYILFVFILRAKAVTSHKACISQVRRSLSTNIVAGQCFKKQKKLAQSQPSIER